MNSQVPIVDDNSLPPPQSVEESVRFVHDTAGIWRVEDEKLRHSVAEEVSLFDDGDVQQLFNTPELRLDGQ